jgi:hypothetical protein
MKMNRVAPEKSAAGNTVSNLRSRQLSTPKARSMATSLAVDPNGGPAVERK